MRLVIKNEIVVTDDDISRVFQNTNFGRSDYRVLLANSVMKKLIGFHCGHTITQIMIELKLISKGTEAVTVKGRRFLAQSFPEILKNSG